VLQAAMLASAARPAALSRKRRFRSAVIEMLIRLLILVIVAFAGQGGENRQDGAAIR
jgi:hypothetical protein